MAIDKAIMLRMLKDAIFSNSDNGEGIPCIGIDSEGEGPYMPHFMDMDGNIFTADFSRGNDSVFDEPLVDWHTQSIYDLGDENTPELAKLYKLLKGNK